MLLKFENQENFENIIKNSENLYVIVDFYAEWCKPCKKLSPIIDNMIDKFDELDFIKVDADINDDIADTYSINELPTILVFSTKNLEIEERFNINSTDDMEKQIYNLCKKYD